MLKSMTGFARAEGNTGLGRVVVEARSVNHRYCDISIKLPKQLGPFETRVKEFVRTQVSRGRIDVFIRVDSLNNDEKTRLSVDLNLADQYLKALRALKKKLGLKDKITLAMMAGAKDIIVAKEESVDIDPYWKEVMPVLKKTFQNLDEMKQVEGASLAKDLRQRLDEIAKQLQMIQQQYPPRLQAAFTRLQDRIRSFVEGMEVDPARFQQEVAFLTERSDITEEIVRAESHLAQFKNLVAGDEPVGRKMEFLLQEIHREVNTISSKVNDAEISQRAVGIKSELEKIREQVQNIE